MRSASSEYNPNGTEIFPMLEEFAAGAASLPPSQLAEIAVKPPIPGIDLL
jgi:hypothetical protein